VRERLAEHEASLRLWPVVGVDEEKNAIDHPQGSFHFAAEIGVTGSVDDIDDLVTPMHRSVLGLDGDALFAFEIHGVHGSIFDFLVGTESPSLLEQGVNEGGLPVVDVSNNGDVADVLVHVLERLW